VVFQEIRIEDKFKFEAQRGDPGHEINFSGSSGTVTSINTAGDHQNTYWNTYAFALVLVAFVVLQLFVIFVCWLCVTYRSRGNRENASIYESAISEYASTVRTPISWDNSYYK
jgi:heme/copper-type cytochrome/quinol oxidase subunit 2